MKKLLLLLVFGISLVPNRSFAVWGDGGAGWAQIPYLVKILSENYKRYVQIKKMITHARAERDYVRALNSGLENTLGILESLPVRDEGIFRDLKDFNKSFKKISKIYGAIPKSRDSAMHLLHDQTVAEGLKMVSDFNKFAKDQERNAKIFVRSGRNASPRGAQRMTVESNAMILKSLGQLMKIETQSLKLQSELLALKNREQKKSASSYLQINSDLKSAFGNFKISNRFLKL